MDGVEGVEFDGPTGIWYRAETREEKKKTLNLETDDAFKCIYSEHSTIDTSPDPQ